VVRTVIGIAPAPIKFSRYGTVKLPQGQRVRECTALAAQNLAMATDGRGLHLCVPYGYSPVRRQRRRRWRPTFFL